MRPSEPRGINDTDERWDDPSAQLDAARDSDKLKKWGTGIVHMDILTETNVSVPCTGFFIAPHVMMTAAHCIGSAADAARTSLRIGARTVPGSALRLMMARAVDFSLVFVEGPPQTELFSLVENDDTELVTWQWPSLEQRKISAVGCIPAPSMFDGIHLKHKCDTVPGASGSPVQARRNGDVIGIHVQGCRENLTPRCVNTALRTREIRLRIFELEAELRDADPEGAAEVFKVISR